MRRITIDEVRAACEKTGYRLVPHITLNREKKCGCPIGVIALANTGESSQLAVAHFFGFDADYRLGFIIGFDKTRNIIPVSNHKNYDIGLADGSAIRAALLPT